jgi:cytochrome c556
MKSPKRAVLAVSASVMLALGVAPWAISGPTGTEAIKARQETMEGVGDAMGGLAAIAKGEAPFDAAVVARNAGTIAEHLQKAAALFPEGSDTGDVETWAKAEIWSDREMFDETLDAAQKAATALQSVTEEAAYRPALGKLGQQCKACHEMYRRPKH